MCTPKPLSKSLVGHHIYRLKHFDRYILICTSPGLKVEPSSFGVTHALWAKSSVNITSLFNSFLYSRKFSSRLGLYLTLRLLSLHFKWSIICTISVISNIKCGLTRLFFVARISTLLIPSIWDWSLLPSTFCPHSCSVYFISMWLGSGLGAHGTLHCQASPLSAQDLYPSH